jgi:hypothetical protein
MRIKVIGCLIKKLKEERFVKFHAMVLKREVKEGRRAAIQVVEVPGSTDGYDFIPVKNETRKIW